MDRFADAGRWLAMLFLCAITGGGPATALSLDPDPEWRRAADLGALVEVLERWLDARAPWPRRDTPPEVRLITPAAAGSLAGVPSRGHGRTRGLYDGDEQVIFLVRPWDRSAAEDASVLLHELIHHRQATSYFYCPGAQEEAAYRLQDAWLRERGLQADVNWIAVVLEAGCTPKDIHPD